MFLNPVRTLSLGQRMRADLAAALIHNPKVIYLDEPTIGLDAVSKEINTMIINANHILLPVGIILGMLTDLFALKWAFVTLADMMGVLLPAFLSVKTVVLNVAIVSACYFGTLAVIKRKTNNVDMVECLKDNRE